MALCLTGAAVAAPGQPPPADAGKAIVSRACQSCHDLGMVSETRHTATEWKSVVQRMRANGADLSDDEAKQVQAYLTKVYGKAG